MTDLIKQLVSNKKADASSEGGNLTIIQRRVSKRRRTERLDCQECNEVRKDFIHRFMCAHLYLTTSSNLNIHFLSKLGQKPMGQES
jgi:protein-arginine kinase activator protein McsA